jgi:ribosomal protein S18 acetylase RimI-like enzyme
MPSPRRRPAAPEIRPARREDLPALARLGAKLARAHHAMDAARFFVPEEPLEAGYAWWLAKERANRRAAVLAAVSPRERIVGYAYGRIEPRDWNTLRDACGVAVDVWVEPAARGTGLGARLVEALVAALAERGADRVVLNVATRNPQAQRLFRRLGFRPTMLEMARECTPAAAPERGRTARQRAGPGAAGTAPQGGRPARARGRTLGA